MRPFDVVMTPIFLLYQDISLLGLRSVGIFITLVSSLSLFLFFSRYASSLFVALCVVPVFLLNVFTSMTPSYYLLSKNFFILSLVLWLTGIVVKKRIFCYVASTLGGGFFGLATLTYLPLGLLFLLPLGVLMFALYGQYCKSNSKELLQSTTLFVLSATAVWVAFFIVLLLMGLFSDFILSLSTFSASLQMNAYKTVGPWSKFISLVTDFPKIVLIGLVMTLVVLVALYITSNITRKSKAKLLLSILIIIVVSALLVLCMRYDKFIQITYIFYAAPRLPRLYSVLLAVVAFSFCIGVFALFCKSKSKDEDTQWRVVRNISVIWGLALTLLYAFTSLNELFTAVLGVPSLFVVGLVSLYRIYVEKAGTGYSKSLSRLVLFGVVITL